MRVNLFAADTARSDEALSARGGLARTFGSLAGFLALLLLCAGLYLIADAWMDPLRAQAAATLAGACSIALGTTVFGYLIQPLKLRRTPGVTQALQRETRPQATTAAENRRANFQPRLAFHRIYADKHWIHPTRDRQL